MVPLVLNKNNPQEHLNCPCSNIIVMTPLHHMLEIIIIASQLIRVTALE